MTSWRRCRRKTPPTQQPRAGFGKNLAILCYWTLLRLLLLPLSLVFNFLLLRQVDIPLKLNGYYRDWSSVTHWSRGQFSINDAVVSFSALIEHLEFIFGKSLLPPGPCMQVPSLYRLGAGCHKLSLTTRPMMREQRASWVWSFLHEHRRRGKTVFDVLPPIPERQQLKVSDLVEPGGDTLGLRKQILSLETHQTQVDLSSEWKHKSAICHFGTLAACWASSVAADSYILSNLLLD